MRLETFHRLLSPEGQAALQAAQDLEPREVDFLPHYQVLSRLFDADLARLALETAIQRRKAEGKFPFAQKLYFDRESLEQASSWQVSSYRCGRFRQFDQLLDLGCSAGGDTLAMAGAAPTLGVDKNNLRLLMAQANAQALGLEKQVAFVQADLRSSLPLAGLPRLTGLFFDPARRAEGRRVHSVRRYAPPLEIIDGWLPSYPALGVKVSPAVKLDELAAYDAEVEFISQDGDLKEALLWFGPLRSAARRATLLPGAHTLTDEESRLELSEPRTYLYEPDPSVLRAGLVGGLGVRLGAFQLDIDIAYLTADRFTETPFARCWSVEDWMPFSLKRLRAYLRERGVGRVTVKKRGSPLQPEDLIRKLRLSGDAERVLFLTHLSGKPVVIIASTVAG